MSVSSVALSNSPQVSPGYRSSPWGYLDSDEDLDYILYHLPLPDVAPPPRRPPSRTVLKGICGLSAVPFTSKSYQCSVPMSIDPQTQQVDPAAPRRSHRVGQAWWNLSSAAQGAAVRDMAVIWRELHQGGGP